MRNSNGASGARRLRLAAVIAVPIAAVGSLGFMFIAGRHNRSGLLIALFTLWVLSPFMAMAWVNAISEQWPAQARTLLYSAMLALALGMPAIYGAVALGPPRPKIAATFLIVPLASLLVVASVATAARLKSRKL